MCGRRGEESVACRRQLQTKPLGKHCQKEQSSVFTYGILKTLNIEIAGGMKENPMGISWALDVPHINWNLVNVFQVLCWVQDLTWTESGEGQEG